jgi:hypothetical protein
MSEGAMYGIAVISKPTAVDCYNDNNWIIFLIQ